MLQIAKYLHAKFWLLLGWLIILSAIALTLLRLTLPFIDLSDYRQEIAQRVQARLGMPLQIGAMHGELLGARLALKFDTISLLDPMTQSPRVHFREAHVQINLLRSLFNGQLILGKVLLVGGRWNLIRHPDGGLSLNGFRVGDGAGLMLGPWLRRLQLSIRDSEIHWHDLLAGTSPILLHRVDANLINQGPKHRLSAAAWLGQAGVNEQRLQLIADLREGSEDLLAVDGRFYLKSENLDLGAGLASNLIPGVAVDRGRLALELWGELQAGRLQRLQGEGELNELMLSAAQAPALELDRFSARFDWRVGPDGWQLDLDRLVMLSNRQLWPPGRLSLAWQSTQDGAKALQLGADYLGLQEAAHLTALLVPQGEVSRQALLGLAPAGHLSRLRFALDQAPSTAIRWGVSGSVSQYRHQPWKAVPGLAGLSMRFMGDQDGGSLRLGSKGFSAHMPKLFRERLTASHMRGYFDWSLDPQTGLHLQTDRLYMVTDHVKTLTRMALRLPWEGENPFIDMQTDFWDGDGAYKSRYLPAGIMPKPLVDWLDRALVSGHVKAGSMLLYGPLKAFPFHNHEGRFEVLFGIEDMVLDYMPDWPRLEEVVAEAHFLNNSLAIVLFEGKLLNSRLRRSEARIRRLKGASPVEINGTVEGSLSDLYRFLSESPLQRRFGKFTAATAGSGQTRTGLELQIPLKKTDAWRIQGQLDLQQARLQLQDYDLALRDLTGQLQFDDKQLWVKGRGIKGRLLDQPVLFDVEPHLQDGQPSTRIKTAVSLQAAWLRQRFPRLLAALDGQARADLQLTIAHGDSPVPVSLSLRSQLQGMAVALPEPLGKASQVSRRLDLKIDFQTDQQRELRVVYGDAVDACLRTQRNDLRQGEVRFSAGVAQFPGQDMLRLRGSLPRLDLDPWIGWLHDQSAYQADAGVVPVHLDLKVADLKLMGMAYADVRFQLAPDPKGWQARFIANDLNGVVRLPRDFSQAPIEGRLKQLRLPTQQFLSAEQADAAKPPGSALAIDPRSLPGLDLQVESLWLGDKPYGRASLQWARSPPGIQVNELSIQGPSLELLAKGYWHKIGAKHLTQIDLVKGHVKDLGELQEDLGLNLGITKASLDVDGVFNWPLPPHALKLNRLSGLLNLQVGAGEVTDVDPGVGRLVGLLSVQALGKRLRLDFSDLYAKGLEFDRIQGHFELNEGDAFTQDLRMASPSAQILIVGRTGLAARDYDQQVTVIPRVSSALPVVGAIAINPAVGVALAVTQGLFGDQVDRIAQTQYQLTGSWEAPDIVRLTRVTDDDPDSSMMPALPAD